MPLTPQHEVPADRTLKLPWERGEGLWRRYLGGTWLRRFVLLGVLVTSAWLGARAQLRREKTRITRQRQHALSIAIEGFRLQIGRCPRGLGEVLHPPGERVAFLSSLPNDGWDRPWHFLCPAPGRLLGYEITSAGPSGDFWLPDNIDGTL